MNDYARNLDTYGDGEDGPEIQAHYKALAGLQDLLADVIDARFMRADIDEAVLMRVVEFVFEHFDDPNDDDKPLRLLATLVRHWGDETGTDQDAFALAMEQAREMISREAK